MRSAVAALDEPLCGVRAHDHHYSDSDRAAAFADWMRLDLEYIDRWSLWLDFTILLRTVPAVLSRRGAS